MGPTGGRPLAIRCAFDHSFWRAYSRTSAGARWMEPGSMHAEAQRKNRTTVRRLVKYMAAAEMMSVKDKEVK